MRYDTFHFVSFLGAVDLLKKNPTSIRWETNKVTDDLKIPVSGVPYILLAKRRYQRHQEEDIHKKFKENYQIKKERQECATNFRPLFY